jgi:Phospholipase_D-nuclease N-terminal
MARFYVLSFLLLLALTGIAMISCLSAEAGTVRGLPRGLWVVLILLVPLVGPVLYFVFGRPRRGDATSTGYPPAPKSRPVAPDDDPDFLFRLGRGRRAPGPTPPGPTEASRAKNGSPANDDSGSEDKGSKDKGSKDKGSKDRPPLDDGQTPDVTDDGRPRGDARTKDDQPPSDGGL